MQEYIVEDLHGNYVPPTLAAEHVNRLRSLNLLWYPLSSSFLVPARCPNCLFYQLVSSFITYFESVFPVYFWFQLAISKLPFLSSAQTFKCTQLFKGSLHMASLLPFVVCKYYNVKARFQEQPDRLQVFCHMLFVSSIIWKIGFERNVPCFVFIFLLEKLSQKLSQSFLLVGK